MDKGRLLAISIDRLNLDIQRKTFKNEKDLAFQKVSTVWNLSQGRKDYFSRYDNPPFVTNFKKGKNKANSKLELSIAQKNKILSNLIADEQL